MADQPNTSDEKTPPADETEHVFYPDGMNPHFVPEETSAEEKKSDDDA